MANTKITRRNDDNHDDDNFFLKLKDTLESSMSRHAEHWVKEQDELSEKFDSLQEAYAELVGRLTSVEAKDFGSAVSKIDSSLKKMISLDHRTEGLEELIRKHETTIVDLKEKILWSIEHVQEIYPQKFATEIISGIERTLVANS